MKGERKQVTVMFTDVSGFTAMSSRLDPEDVHEIMDRCFEVVLEAVHRYEGTINQFLGDGVMALFGAPIAHEDHPHRGLRAALAVQASLTPLRDEVRRRHGVDFRLRIGLNTGLVVVGAIGRDLRMDYTAIGDTTNLAARILNIAQPGQIALSAITYRLTEGYFAFEDLGRVPGQGQDRADPGLRGDGRAEGSDQAGGLPRSRSHAVRGAPARAGPPPRSLPAGRRGTGLGRPPRRRAGGRQVPAPLRVFAACRGVRRPRPRGVRRLLRRFDPVRSDPRSPATLPRGRGRFDRRRTADIRHRPPLRARPRRRRDRRVAGPFPGGVGPARVPGAAVRDGAQGADVRRAP